MSATHQSLAESARFLRDLLQADGWNAEVVEVGTNPVVFAEIGPQRAPSVLFYGHHDVQPADSHGWTSPPFQPAIRDGRIWGRGAADNKGQFFCHVFAVRALRRTMGNPKVRVKLVLDGEEEMGSPHLQKFAREQRDRLVAGFAFTADGPVHSSGRPCVMFGVRGVLKLRLTVRTMASDLHSGNFGNLAPNAALRLAHLVAALKGSDGNVRIPGFYEGIREPGPLEREALANIAFDPAHEARGIGARSLEGPDGVSGLERLMFRPTFNVAGLASGYTGPGFKTVIPAEAVAMIDVRLVADQDPDRIFAAIRDHVRLLDPEAQLERLGHYRPSRTPMDTPAAKLVIRAVETGFGEEPLRYPCIGASSPDAVLAQELRLPSLLVPYGNADERNHAPDENMRIDHLYRGSRTSAALLLAMGSG